MNFANMTNEQKIAAIGERVIEANKERTDSEKSANAHEQSAREDRRKMTDLKKEIEQLSAVLRNAQVARNIETAEAAALRAQKEAETILARAVEKEKAADALLAELNKPA